MKCVVTSVVGKRWGALPVAAEFLRRLDVAGTVDRLCPGRDIAHVTHGQVVEALVAGAVERGYGDFKGPPAVTPVFVRDNKRVAALTTVICLALLLFCLIERQVRRALGSEHKMHGPCPDSQKVQPTGRMVLYHLSDLRLRVTSATDPPVIAIPRGNQLYLIDLLGLGSAQPRWPQS